MCHSGRMLLLWVRIPLGSPAEKPPLIREESPLLSPLSAIFGAHCAGERVPAAASWHRGSPPQADSAQHVCAGCVVVWGWVGGHCWWGMPGVGVPRVQRGGTLADVNTLPGPKAAVAVAPSAARERETGQLSPLLCHPVSWV